MQRIPVIAEWPNGPFEKWAHSYCRKNFWRVEYIFGSYEDMVCQCALLYVDCCRRYGAKVNSQAHFMCLFKLMVTSYINSISPKDYKIREMHGMIKDEEISVQSDASLAIKLRECSLELQVILNTINYAPKEIMDTFRADARSSCPRQFFKCVMRFCGIEESKSKALTEEFKALMS